MCLLVTVYLIWRNIYSNTLSNFKLSYLSFCSWVVSVLYISLISDQYQIFDLQIFSPIMWAVFSLSGYSSTPYVWFHCSRFQLPVVNHSLNKLNGKFQKWTTQKFWMSCHPDISFMTNSPALPLLAQLCLKTVLEPGEWGGQGFCPPGWELGSERAQRKINVKCCSRVQILMWPRMEL